MTLEDFFTLTEMKDGLTVPARVEELISVIKKEADSLVKNVGDATRRWTAVAGTIVATVDKECLDLFVQLDGLLFIDRWLKDAQTIHVEGGDSYVEEAISALLQAVGRFQMGNDKLISSGIHNTVESLLAYKSARVQDRAKNLLDSWKAKDIGLLRIGIEKKDAVNGDSMVIDEHPETLPAAANVLPISSHDNQTLESVEGEMIKISNVLPQRSSDDANFEDRNPNAVVSCSVKMECAEGNISVNDEEKIEATSESLKPELVSEDAKHDNRIKGVQDEPVKDEVSSASYSRDKNDSKTAEEVAAKPDHNLNYVKDEMSVESASSKDTDFNDSESPGGKDSDQGEGPSALEETKDQGATSGMEEAGKCSETRRRHKSNRTHFGNTCKFSKLIKTGKVTDIGQADMDLEDGTVDALDIARLVANEVEREVVGYDEESVSEKSSSADESISKGRVRQPSSPESINEEQNSNMQTDDPPANELSAIENVSHAASGKEHVIDSPSQETKLENVVQDMESSQVIDALQEVEINTKKPPCGFDLNLEFSSEDVDHQVDTNNCSRQRQVFLDIDLNMADCGDDNTMFPVSGKQDQTLPSLPSGESSVELTSKRSEGLKFDLNQIGEEGDAPVSEWKFGGQLLGTQNGRRSPSPSSSSSCFQPAMRAFDLNDNPSNACNDPLPSQRPFLSESPYVGPSDDSVISILGTKIKKTGVPVPVSVPPQTVLPFPNGRTTEPLIDAGLLRGGAFVGLGSAVPYPQPVYSYNGLAMGPIGPFPSGPTYGPGSQFPYMFDSRGTPIMPQIINSASTVLSSHSSSSSPLVMNMTGGASAGSNYPSGLRPNLDLNSAYAVERGNREPQFLRPFFIPGHGRPLLEDQLRDNIRHFNSGAGGGKRKEPDGGWELYSANHQPPYL